jgi:DNA-3-methyladenine glycosylase II
LVANRYEVLVRSITSQQLSTKAAETIFQRLRAALPGRRLKPESVADADDETLRAAGYSANKVRSLRDLTARVLDGRLPLARLPRLDDESVIDRLVAVHGIGRWTAEMFLIFSLGRLDVLPVDDLGLRAAVRDVYGLGDLPARRELVELGEAWRPYRSIATWYLWRSRGFVPQSQAP